MSFTESDRDTRTTPYRTGPEATSTMPPPAYGTTTPPPAAAPMGGRPRATHEHHKMRETKTSFLTTEFWAMVAGIVALVVLYNWTDNPDLTLWRTCLLSTVLAGAYIVSRGWAKSGSHADHVDEARGY